MHLKTHDVSPPGEYRFIQKESGYSMKGTSFGALLGKVTVHRANMGYAAVSPGFASLTDELEDWICQSLSQQDQVEYCQVGLGKVTSVNWKRIAQFLKTMATWFTTNQMQTVPPEEAERRAGICAGCPFNVGLSGCGICRQTLDGVRAALVQGHTSHDDKLNACGVCGCDNKFQVHIPLDTLKANQVGNPPYPVWCWKSTPLVD